MSSLPQGVELIHYVGSGNYLVTHESGLLLRYDDKNFYFWDTKYKREIAFERAAFNELVSGQPTETRQRRTRIFA